MLFVLLITFLIVLVLGILYVVTLRRFAQNSTGWWAVALTALWAGILAVVLTALTAILSFTTMLDALPFRDPLAMIAFLGLPAALIGVGCGVVGLNSNARSQAVVGLVLSAACIAAWTIMATVAY